MPAIDLTKLDKQINDLASSFDNPAEFRVKLHDLLSYYHLYARKPSKEKLPKSFMRHYEIPDQVIRQIELGLKPCITARPQQSLDLARELWKDDYFESRHLAAYLLGQLGPDQAAFVQTTLETWLDQSLDHAVLDTLLNNATRSLRASSTQEWDRFLGKLLDSRSERLQYAGLLALAADLPKRPLTAFIFVYKALRPFFQSSEAKIHELLYQIVEILAKRNPSETVYFLKQVLAETNQHAIERQMRRFIPFFNPDQAASLRESIRNHSSRKF